MQINPNDITWDSAPPRSTLDNALIAQESGGNWGVSRSDSKATGGYQITPVYLQDGNKFAGTSFTLNDMHDPEKAQVIKDAWEGHYYTQFENENGRQPSDREKAMMHHGGPGGWKQPDARDSLGVSNSEYADQVLGRMNGVKSNLKIDPNDITWDKPLKIDPNDITWDKPKTTPKQPGLLDQAGSFLSSAAKHVGDTANNVGDAIGRAVNIGEQTLTDGIDKVTGSFGNAAAGAENMFSGAMAPELVVKPVLYQKRDIGQDIQAVQSAFKGNPGEDSPLVAAGKVVQNIPFYVDTARTQGAQFLSGLLQEAVKNSGPNDPEWLKKLVTDGAYSLSQYSPTPEGFQKPRETPINASKGSLAGAIKDFGPYVPSLAVGIVNPVAGAVMAGMQTAGDQYQQDINSAVSNDMALKHAGVSGMSQTALFSLPVHKILGPLMAPELNLIQRTLGGAVSGEMLGKFSQAMQIGIDKGTVNPNITFGQAWDQWSKEGNGAGAVVGGLLGAAAHPFVYRETTYTPYDRSTLKNPALPEDGTQPPAPPIIRGELPPGSGGKLQHEYGAAPVPPQEQTAPAPVQKSMIDLVNEKLAARGLPPATHEQLSPFVEQLIRQDQPYTPAQLPEVTQNIPETSPNYPQIIPEQPVPVETQVNSPELVNKSAEIQQEVPVNLPELVNKSLPELEKLYSEKKSEESQGDLSVFGTQERLDAYNKALRMRDSYDEERSKKGDDLVQEIESNLTEDQRNKLFLVGYSYTSDDIKALIDAAGQLDFSSPEALGASLRYAVTKIGKPTSVEKMDSTQLEAYYQFKTAEAEVQKRGWDSSIVSKHAIEGAASRFTDPQDAEFMLQQFIKPSAKQAEIIPKIIPENIQWDEASPDLQPKAEDSIKSAPETVTDQARKQEILNSIREGEMLIESGKSISGEPLSDAMKASIRRSIANAKSKIGQSDGGTLHLPGSTPVLEEEPVTNGVKNIIKGGETDLIANGKEYGKGQYALIEKGDIVASHYPDSFKENKSYPQERQNRDYTSLEVRGKAEDIIKGITDKGFKEILQQGYASDSGIPVVNNAGEVLSGNNRTFAILRDYQKYHNALKGTNLAQFGLHPNDLAGMKEPVLVRSMTDKGKEPDFVIDSNVQQVKGLTSSEIQKHYTALPDKNKADARKAISGIYEEFNKSGDAKINTFLGNLRVSELPTVTLRQLQESQVLSPSDIQRNSLTSVGIEKIKILALTLLNEDMRVSSPALDYLTESKEGNANLDRKFDAAIGDLFRMKDEQPEEYKSEMEDLGKALVRVIDFINHPDQYKAQTRELSLSKAARGVSVTDEPLSKNAETYLRALASPTLNSFKNLVGDKVSMQEDLFSGSSGNAMSGKKSKIFSKDRPPEAAQGDEAPETAKDAFDARKELHANTTKIISKDSTGNRWVPLDDVMRWLIPASRSIDARETALTIRQHAAEMAHKQSVAVHQTKAIVNAFWKISPQARLQFIFDMESGRKQPNSALQEMADTMRKMIDSRRLEIQKLGNGKLDQYIEDYFPHIWKNPEKNGFFNRRPIEGSKSFLKQRSIPTVEDGLKWRVYSKDGDMLKSFSGETDARAFEEKLTDAGIKEPLELVTNNPMELVLLKSYEMDRYLFGQKLMTELKDRGLLKFVYASSKPEEGMVPIDDRSAVVYAPPEIDIEEAYDEKLMQGLMDFSKSLGIDVQRKVKIGGDAWGRAYGDKKIVTKFAGPETVLEHEIGHIIDNRYGLFDYLQKSNPDPVERKEITKELRDLADMRYEGNDSNKVDDSFKKYVRRGSEKAANLVHAYLYARDRMRDVAPNTFKAFERFLKIYPELSGLKDIKPSLVLGTSTGKLKIPGVTILGRYHAQEAVATILNNHLSPGLNGKWYYEMLRQPGNLLNQAQLGLSAFHLTFTAMDSTISKVALGIEKVSQGKIGSGLSDMAKGVVPLYAPITNILIGDKLVKLYRESHENFIKGDKDLQAMVEGIISAGGRVTMDQVYKNSSVENFRNAWRNVKEGPVDLRYSSAGSAVWHALGAVMEKASSPIMEYMVPRMKLGVFADMAKNQIERLGPDANHEEVRDALAKVWDSVDNRLGQVVYDNLFWHRTMKDIGMISVRSLGWNLGTFRELGGGGADVLNAYKRVKDGDSFMTHRLSYLLALPAVTALYGALYQYLATGEGPQELRDYFFPKTGKRLPNGNKERISIPGYMPDVYKFSSKPFDTILHKQSPLISMTADMIRNKDFYGVTIMNEDDPVISKLISEGKYIGKQFLPFSVRNAQQAKDNGGEFGSMARGFVGLSNAPASIVNTKAENMMAEYGRQNMPAGSRTQEQADKSKLTGQLRNALYLAKESKDPDATTEANQKIFTAMKTGEITQVQEKRILSGSGIDPEAYHFKGLHADQAMKVYEAGTDEEKGLFRPIMIKKMQSAWRNNPEERTAISDFMTKYGLRVNK